MKPGWDEFLAAWCEDLGQRSVTTKDLSEMCARKGVLETLFFRAETERARRVRLAHYLHGVSAEVVTVVYDRSTKSRIYRLRDACGQVGGVIRGTCPPATGRDDYSSTGKSILRGDFPAPAAISIDRF
jgi:hypothetical protein